MEAADGRPLWDPRRRMTALWQEQEEEGGAAGRGGSEARPATLEAEADAIEAGA